VRCGSKTNWAAQGERPRRRYRFHKFVNAKSGDTSFDVKKPVITRFAPSPTGPLHLGHAFSAWLSWRLAPAGFLVRLEDIDRQRCRPDYAAAILQDLAWLGLISAWPVRVQSAHFDEYRAVLARLAAFTYPCACSRAQISLAAPHGAPARYPGTCRALPPAARAAILASGRPYALRLDAALAQRAAGRLRYHEHAAGWTEIDPGAIDDAILARRDTPASYHLCVVHDDALQGVTHVVRGEDLRDSTPLHVLLQRLLGFETPHYRHHRLLHGADGRRLAKRDRAASLADMRAAGVTPAEILRGFEGLE
jgi:glutamyl-Q tRNA(Asp) synthetase